MFMVKSPPIFSEFTNGSDFTTKPSLISPQKLRRVLLSAGSPVTFIIAFSMNNINRIMIKKIDIVLDQHQTLQRLKNVLILSETLL